MAHGRDNREEDILGVGTDVQVGTNVMWQRHTSLHFILTNGKLYGGSKITINWENHKTQTEEKRKKRKKENTFKMAALDGNINVVHFSTL